MQNLGTYTEMFLKSNSYSQDKIINHTARYLLVMGYFFAIFIFLFKPSSFVLFTADPLKTDLKTSSVKSCQLLLNNSNSSFLG